MGDAVGPHFSENTLEIQGFGRCNGVVENIAAVTVIQRADDTDRYSGACQNVFKEGCGGGPVMWSLPDGWP